MPIDQIYHIEFYLQPRLSLFTTNSDDLLPY